MRIIECPSRNFDDRAGGQSPSMVILHYTGTKTADEARAIFESPVAAGAFGRVAPHYMIDGDAAIYKFVAEEKRAWHAGRAAWGDVTDINSASIGIEIWNSGHEFDFEDFIPAQIDAVMALIQGIRSRWDIPDKHILGHSDVAPGRKLDPGEKFPWRQLAEAGIGVMPDIVSPPPKSSPLKGEDFIVSPSPLRGEGRDGGEDFYVSLRKYGYTYPADNLTLLTEFRRHFLPHLLGVDGVTEDDKRALFDISSKISA